jgi:hypothetical protein
VEIAAIGGKRHPLRIPSPLGGRVVRWRALAILLTSLAWRILQGATEPFRLVALVTPANLFTGVLACGWISLLNLWSDHRFAARPADGLGADVPERGGRPCLLRGGTESRMTTAAGSGR